MASTRRTVVYSAAGCHLCEAAVEVVRKVCGEDFELIAIDGVPELEARYRRHLPVVEIDGERAFTFFVDPEALKARLSGS